MPLLSELKLGWLIFRAAIGFVLLVWLFTLVLALLGIEPFREVYGVQTTYNDPAPLWNWLYEKSALAVSWWENHQPAGAVVAGIVLFLVIVKK